MPIKYGRKQKQNTVFYTVTATILIISVFLSAVVSFYIKAEDEAYEMLHMQTKQIKDDIILQIKSDRENLETMASFAAKLYADGESYELLFESFKPIGLLSNIGILDKSNNFTTLVGTLDLNGKISFEEEAARGTYISGRVPDLTRYGKEIIRSAVPIKVNEEIVGILYGVITLENMAKRYNSMARELDAQLFVYNKETGKFLIDTIDKTPGELAQLESREYNNGSSYEDFLEKENGFISFKSIFTGEDLFVHFSTIEDFNWGIMLARYESQVFASTHSLALVFLIAFSAMIMVMVAYLLFILIGERHRSKVTKESSAIRKILLEINHQHGNVKEALKRVQEISVSRSAFFTDVFGEDYNYVLPDFTDKLLEGEERKYFIGELFFYAAKYRRVNESTVGIMRIIPNAHLLKTNPGLYEFFEKHDIKEVVFAIITDKNNHVSILGVINPDKTITSIALLEDVAVCFSIAIFNKNHLHRTEMAATTDSLTGVLNRVSFKKDIVTLDKERPEEISCIYIDVNELHLRNNKYGHAAGDEMLIYIANSLKEVFYGHKIYRMGGDEFLVFCIKTDGDTVRKNIDVFIEQLRIKEYNVAIGMSYRKQNTNCEELVREAEKRMYEAKAKYYQNKEEKSIAQDTDKNYEQIKTGIREIDAMISVLKEHYNGIYRVSLNADSAHRILMPSYLGYKEYEEHFSALLAKYINEIVHPDFQRAVISFLNYDAIKRHIAEGNIPKISYKKVDGENVILSVYSLEDSKETVDETLWVFKKG